MSHRLVHLAAVTETHFDLGRVHVDVHPQRIDLDHQNVDRLALAVQHVLVGAACCMGDDLVAHVAAVDIGVLLVGAAAGVVGQATAAAHAYRAAGRLHAVINGQALRQEVIAQDVGQTLFGIVCGTPLFDQLAVVPDREANMRAGERMATHGVQAMRQLRGVGLEELAAGRRAEKQFLDFDRGARGAGAGAQFAAACVEKVPVGGIGGGREQGEFGDGSDGGQCFTTEAHGGHGFEIMQAADLAGGVALHGERELLGRDAATVVLDGNQAHATGLQADGDLGRAGIEGIVQQFAHHGSGAFDDFAGGDLADELVREGPDGAGGGEGVHRNDCSETSGYTVGRRKRAPAAIILR